MRLLPVPCLLLTAIVLGSLLAPLPRRPGPAASAATGTPADPEREAFQRAQSFFQRGAADSGSAVLDSLAAAARAAGNERLVDRVATARAIIAIRGGHAAQGEALARPVVSHALARRDTLAACRAAIWLSQALQDQARYREAESLLVRLVPLAAAGADAESEGFLRMGLAYTRLMSGRAEGARPDYLIALEKLRESGNTFGRLNALIGLGRVHHEMGEVDSAMSAFRDAAELARDSANPYIEANARNNLGTEAAARGDPAVALDAYRASAAVWRGLGNVSEAAAPVLNSARVLASLGRLGEARSLVDSVLAACRGADLVVGEIMALSTLHELHEQAGDAAGVDRTARAILDLGESVPPGGRLKAWQALATARALEDSLGAASAILEGPALGLRPLVSADFQAELDLDRSRLLLRLGRRGEAALIASSAEPLAAGVNRPDLRSALLVVLAKAAIAEGRRDDALADLAEAEKAWEDYRARPSGVEFRERRAAAQELYETILAAHLAGGDTVGAATGDAWNAVRRFKSRALEDRIRNRGSASGPHAVAASDAMPGWLPLDAFQHDVLREGEVFLDVFAGDETAYVFAITPATCRVTAVPDAAALESRIRTLRDLVSTPPGPRRDEARDAIIRATVDDLAMELFGAFEPLLRDARLVIWSPDAALNLVPVDPFLAALGIDAVTSRVPSANLLASIRVDASVRPDRHGSLDPATLLVLHGATDAGGARLEGAVAEARAIARRYRNAHEDAPAREGVRDFSGYALVHLAAHAEVNDAYPWRSSIRLGAETGDTLRAEDVARQALDARLVVLSACESAAGVVIPGEGVLGLSSAFLAAGSDAVVAALWPVEDRATRDFMLSFYDHLSRGSTAGEALRGAQAGIARGGRAADPYHGAGFVLIGDPGVRVRIERRGLPVAFWIITAIAAGVPALLGWRRLRPGRRAGPGQERDDNGAVTRGPRNATKE